jgi:hypothetical protein
LLEQAIVVGLAGWRLASLVTREEGPFRIFERLRRLAGAEQAGEMTGLAKLVSCVWCFGVYTASASWAVYEFWRPEPVVLVAAWAVVIAVERWNAGG